MFVEVDNTKEGCRKCFSNGKRAFFYSKSSVLNNLLGPKEMILLLQQ